MSKLISNPLDCGHHPNCATLIGFRKIKLCFKDETIECNNAFKFPKECPLKDGKTHDQFLEDMEPNIVHIQRTAFGSIVKPKRRNRKDCVHYEVPDKFGHFTCSAPFLPTDCRGVTCGSFETKTD